MDYTIFCVLPDDKPAFPVEIQSTQTVGALRGAIKLEMARTLHTCDPVDARDLRLYHINVKFDESSKEEHLEEVRKIFLDLSNREPLREWHGLSKINDGFPEGVLHILVVPPPGESIYSRAYG